MKNYKIIGTKKVSDFEDKFNYIDDTQEIKELLNSIGIKNSSDIASLFASFKDGDIEEIYFIEGIIPYLNKLAYRIY